MNLAEESVVLSSWKDIARYMGKGVRTVQRWERHLGLPVRRPNCASHKSAVLLNREDLEVWLATRFSARPAVKEPAIETSASTIATRTKLRNSIQTARQLRDANLALTLQITESIRELTERCNLLSNQTLRHAWHPTGSQAPVLQDGFSMVETERLF